MLDFRLHIGSVIIVMEVNDVKVTNNGRKNASLIKVHKWYWIFQNKWLQTIYYTVFHTKRTQKPYSFVVEHANMNKKPCDYPYIRVCIVFVGYTFCDMYSKHGNLYNTTM